ncbi:membrane protein [Aliivibrio wodanis]|uniref:Membrane protein n=1 Tax=Aliivibrio wodanis TaxID=80852 RepID=A0A090K024_9GAMM|nr:membrane protein [Aliivibrio wodanis]
MPALSVLLMDSFNYFKTHFIAFCILVLPFALITNGIALSFNEEDGSGKFFIYMLFILTIYPFYKGAILYYIAYSFDGRRVPFSQLYQIPAKTWFSFVLMNIILGLAVLTGFIALILPGLYLMARFSFTEIYCVLYKENSTDAIKLGWNDTKDNYWLLFKGLVIIFGLTTGLVWVSEYALGLLGLSSPVLSFIFSILEVILSMMNTIFIFRVFTINTTRLEEIQQIS